MENEPFSEDASGEEIVNTIAELASNQEESALAELRKLLRFDLRFSGNELVAVSRLATRALLQKGKPGVEILSGAVLGGQIGESRFDVPAILEGLWHAAHGQLPPKGIQLVILPNLGPVISRDFRLMSSSQFRYRPKMEKIGP